MKRVVIIPAVIIVAVTLLAVALFPNLPSVATTGAYAFASERIEFDTARTETFLEDGSTRKITALVYYPKNDGNITKGSCPLIIFSHGGMSFDTSNLSLYKELASHGYVVAGISHTYHALNTNIGGKNVLIDSGYMNELNKEDSHTDIENSYALFQKWMSVRTADINYVIDALIEKALMEEALPESFYTLIDTENIGLAGHSLGGAAALGTARQREDIKAVIALESPFMCDITGVDGTNFTWNTEPYTCAVLNIYSDSAFPALIETDNKYVQNKNYPYEHIEGSNHYSLTDLSRTSPILCALLGGGYENGYETLQLINGKSVAFFDEYLKGLKH